MVLEKKIFVNLTAHKLTEEQIKAAKEKLGVDEIVEAEEIVSKKLLDRLRQCPSDKNKLIDMAYELADELYKYAIGKEARLYVHLPTGSPAFMWVFANVFPHKFMSAVFSHTRREVIKIEQQDGSVIKKSVFKFRKFIVF